MKLSPVVLELKKRGIPQFLVDTGQHYDENMSRVFIEGLGLPEPDIYLGVGSDTHARQTARIMMAFEEVCQERLPNLVIAGGDVNYTWPSPGSRQTADSPGPCGSRASVF